MASEYFTVLVFIVVGVGFAVVSLLLSWLLRRDRPGVTKLDTYECGEEPVGQAWSRFRIGFYIFTLIFVVFEVESVFLFPVAMNMLHFKSQGLGLLVLFELLAFVAVLLFGLVYAWKKGVLKWE